MPSCPQFCFGLRETRIVFISWGSVGDKKRERPCLSWPRYLSNECFARGIFSANVLPTSEKYLQNPKQSDKDLLSYRVNDEVSADVTTTKP